MEHDTKGDILFFQHYSVAAVIEVFTGLVVDSQVLSTYCHACACNQQLLGDNTQAFQALGVDHSDDCCRNYFGSANSMEVEDARRLWQRSAE